MALTDRERSDIEATLRANLQTLLAEIEYEKEETGDQIAHRGDEPRESSAESSAEGLRDVNTALLSHHRDEVIGIRQALKRLEAGTFGVCTQCGETITTERLQASPAAARCLECQAAAESR